MIGSDNVNIILMKEIVENDIRELLENVVKLVKIILLKKELDPAERIYEKRRL